MCERGAGERWLGLNRAPGPHCRVLSPPRHLQPGWELQHRPFHAFFSHSSSFLCVLAGTPAQASPGWPKAGRDVDVLWFVLCQGLINPADVPRPGNSLLGHEPPCFAEEMGQEEAVDGLSCQSRAINLSQGIKNENKLLDFGISELQLCTAARPMTDIWAREVAPVLAVNLSPPPSHRGHLRSRTPRLKPRTAPSFHQSPSPSLFPVVPSCLYPIPSAKSAFGKFPLSLLN